MFCRAGDFLLIVTAIMFSLTAEVQQAHGINWDPDNNRLTVGPDNELMVGLYSFGAYSSTADTEMADAVARGFNVIHTYSFRNQSGTQNPTLLTPNQYLTKAASHGLSVMMQLGIVTPSEPDVPLAVPADIQALATNDNIALWSIVPEEISWYPPGPDNTKFAQLKQWADNVHANDPKQRPVYHYLASNYAEIDLSAYTGFIDAVSAGAYADYASKPRPWIRWRIEQEVNAIRNTGNRQGAFPMAVLQMFASEGNPGETMMQANDGYHDAYLSLVSGAKAIMIFTAGRRNEIPGLYDRYSDFAREINGPERLGDVFLKGTDLGAFAPIKPTVIAGPAKSESFTENFAWPPSGPTFQYDSISYRVMARHGRIYVVAVNSAEQPVTASFPGIRTSGPIDVLFQDRQVATANNQLTDTFTALGVNNYRLPANSNLIVAEESFNGPDGAVSGWTPVHGNGTIVNLLGVTTLHRGTAATEYMTRNLPPVNLPSGAFLELQVKAALATQFYLELVDPQGGSAALINWQSGSGDWQTLRADFSGSWRATSSLWLGIRGGGSYEIGQLGVYFKAIQTGDYNGDDVVDASDYVVWRKTLGSTSNLAADGNENGVVDVDDYHFWRHRFSTTNEFVALGSLTVPEPAAMYLMDCCACYGIFVRGSKSIRRFLPPKVRAVIALR